MKHSILALAVAGVSLIGSAAIQATVLVELEVRDAVVAGDTMPRSLSDFGFFTDAAGRDPAFGVELYELNTPLWSDGADKLRYIYVPSGEQLTGDGEGLLQFPVGSAIIKTFAFGEGDEQRYIETRVLLHRADGWIAPVSYTHLTLPTIQL